MTRQIILTILFGLGFLNSIYEIIREWKSKQERMPYKIKYYALWAVIYNYLVSIQYEYFNEDY